MQDMNVFLGSNRAAATCGTCCWVSHQVDHISVQLVSSLFITMWDKTSNILLDWFSGKMRLIVSQYSASKWCLPSCVVESLQTSFAVMRWPTESQRYSTFHNEVNNFLCIPLDAFSQMSDSNGQLMASKFDDFLRQCFTLTAGILIIFFYSLCHIFWNVSSNVLAVGEEPTFHYKPGLALDIFPNASSTMLLYLFSNSLSY